MNELNNHPFLTLAGVLATLSEDTCGEACWNAKEDICKCSCAGENHGIHRRGGVAVRTSRIDGFMYQLQGVGKHRDLVNDAEKINDSIIVSAYWDYAYNSLKICKYDHKERKASARVKYATQGQIDRWKELEAYKGKDRYKTDLALLWIRCDFDTQESIQISELELQIGEMMKNYTMSQRNFVWDLTKAINPGLQFWREKDCYNYLYETIIQYDFIIDEIEDKSGYMTGEFDKQIQELLKSVIH